MSSDVSRAAARKSRSACADLRRLLAAVRQRRNRHHGAIMDFADVLRRRKMVRNYTDEPVQREVVERIVARGTQGAERRIQPGQSFRGRHRTRRTPANRRAGGRAHYLERGLRAVDLASTRPHRRRDARERLPRSLPAADKLDDDGKEIEWPRALVVGGRGQGNRCSCLLAAIDEGLGAGLFGLSGTATTGCASCSGCRRPGGRGRRDDRPRSPETRDGSRRKLELEAARGGRPLGALVAGLAAARIGDTFNQYGRSRLRRERLEAYLAARRGASIVLVGEAAGYRGARVSGIPFTSERQLTGSGPAEATATIVHRVLAELGIENEVLLWNVVPTHPHEPGRPSTNRRPTRAEVGSSVCTSWKVLLGAAGLYPSAGWRTRSSGATYVRHPSHGGAAASETACVD